jgi:hypothetical protein
MRRVLDTRRIPWHLATLTGFRRVVYVAPVIITARTVIT